MTTQAREKLFKLIKEKSYRYSPTAEFNLSSGGKSNFYFDMKMTMLDPVGIDLIADLLVEKLAKQNGKYVAGLELGAVPLIMAACLRGYHALIVRKEQKGHGTKRLLEGPLDPTAEVVLLDDVTTKGDSVLAAIKEVRKAGCTVTTVITLVDRQDEARQKLKDVGVTLDPIFTLNDFHPA